MRLLRHSTIGKLSAAAGVVALASCTSLPDLSEATGGIPVNDVVLRVKCELADAFEMTDPDGTRYWLPDKPRFKWMNNWTAQVDLTLEILDTSTFAPGGSVTEPFHNAYSTTAGPSSISTAGVPGTSIGSISQNLTVAAGLSINGQATRTQTMSFNFSLAELDRWYKRPETVAQCKISNGSDLRGKLGLKEWVAMVIEPVQGDRVHGELLYAGYHEKPETVSKSAGPGSNKPIGPIEGPAKEHLAVLGNCNVAEARSSIDASEKKFNDFSPNFLPLPIDAAIWTSKASTRIDQIAATLAVNKKSAVSDLDTLKSKIKDTQPYNAVLEPDIKRSLAEDARKAKAFENDIAQREITTQTAVTDAHNALATASPLLSSVENFRKTAKSLLDKYHDVPGPKDSDVCTMSGSIPYNVDSAIAMTPSALSYQSQTESNTKAAEDAADSLTSVGKSVSSVSSSIDTIDPPISTFGQSVNFLVVMSANVTPTWTFAKFKGPNANLFSAGSTRTHTLNITIGSPNQSANLNLAITQNQLLLGLNSGQQQAEMRR